MKMKHRVAFLLVASLAFAPVSCVPDFFHKPDGKFQPTPTNLEALNSEFDDYNVNVSYNRSGYGNIVFSSKRDRKNVFNLVVKPFELEYDDRKDKLSMVVKDLHYSDIPSTDAYERLAQKANQNCNVLGPVFYGFDEGVVSGTAVFDSALLLYADDCAGNLQIKFVHNFNSTGTVEGPFEVKWLNSPQDDAYPTFNSDLSRLYFCSNRDGNFDIFEVSLSTRPIDLLKALLSEDPRVVTKNQQLSTPYDDKCPFMKSGGFNETMYFTSNRPGGQGGFGLYYALTDGKKWGTPVNLGPRINTKYDEYRPFIALSPRSYFKYHLGIFSSNRPGGKGGFDLYMAGFLKLTETKLPGQ